ncbi:Glutathione synthetase [Eubacterium plexicaudatum ASF492]|uniref:RimK family alpha-L-glutamate ligase n=1 Tax=Eubacterium plexicaudatum ASF492 TaxID=1235802 RepID=N2AGK3_9FIRM|nr:Glutathione synthetase [Eubacterium plexicaudatum ASF492]
MEMIYAWLVVNGFIESEKFSQIFAWLVKAAKKQGCMLDIKTNTQLLPELVMGDVDLSLHGRRPQFVIFWDKDIRLARLLEKLGLRLFNCARSIEICDDKARTYLELYGQQIRMPKTIIAPKTFRPQGYSNPEFLSGVERRLGFPMVVKECYGSFGQQVWLVGDEQELLTCVGEIKNRPFLFQEYIASSKGSDIRIQMVGKKAVAAMHRYHATDFRANITNGGSMERYEPNEQQLQLAQKVMETLKLDFAGVDILFGEQGEPVLCEVNSNAHFINIWKCTGVNTADAIIGYCLDRSSTKA